MRPYAYNRCVIIASRIVESTLIAFLFFCFTVPVNDIPIKLKKTSLCLCRLCAERIIGNKRAVAEGIDQTSLVTHGRVVVCCLLTILNESEFPVRSPQNPKHQSEGA
jgi:hypothetical protein